MKVTLRFNTVTVLLCIATLASAQVDTAIGEKPRLTLSGFLDVFYVYDFNEPMGPQRQPFLYNHNRHNEFNLNLGLIKLAAQHSKYRANLALQTGTYANDNYAAEPGLLKNIFEANIGISLNAKNNLWLDAGVLPSHIGFESAISVDNPTLTRSLLAENSPYFLTGAKLTYKPGRQWEMTALLVNGWQRIQRVQGNSLPSAGTQLSYSPSQKVTVNWNTFIGTDDPDSTRRMRYFNNFYGRFQLHERLRLITGFDIGLQQRTKGSSEYNLWLSPVIIGELYINPKWQLAVRAEYYQDETGIIITATTPQRFNTTGLSINVDYTPHKNIRCRLEGRWLNSEDPIFETSAGSVSSNFIVGASLAVRFAESLNK